MAANIVQIPLRGLHFDEIATRLASDPGFICLDARHALAPTNRYSILASCPISTFSMAGAFITVDGHTTIDRPYSALCRFVSRVQSWGSDPYLPFSGGVLGYIGFEGGRALRGGEPANGFSRHSQCRLGLYPAAILLDHIEDSAVIVGTGETETEANAAALATLERLDRVPPPTQTIATEAGVTLRCTPRDAAFQALVDCARSWIRAESAASIHLVRHAHLPFTNTSAMARFLATRAPGCVRSFFTHEGASYAVASTDTALAVTNRELCSTLSLPLATHDRTTPVRAFEHELAPFCTGTLFTREQTHATHHQVSLCGHLAHGISAIDALIALLPLPTRTGAPYHRAMNFIEQHEEEHRCLYGGAFGLIDALHLRFHTIERVTCVADGMMTTTSGIDVTADTNPHEVVQHLHSHLPTPLL